MPRGRLSSKKCKSPVCNRVLDILEEHTSGSTYHCHRLRDIVNTGSRTSPINAGQAYKASVRFNLGSSGRKETLEATFIHTRLPKSDYIIYQAHLKYSTCFSLKLLCTIYTRQVAGIPLTEAVSRADTLTQGSATKLSDTPSESTYRIHMLHPRQSRNPQAQNIKDKPSVL